MQIFPRLACKIASCCRQKYMQFADKNAKITVKNTRQTQAKKYLQVQAKTLQQSQAKMPASVHKNTCNFRQSAVPQIASKLACILQVSLPATCVLYYVLSGVFCMRCLPCGSREIYLFLQLNCM